MPRIPMLVVADAGPLIALAVSGVLPASVGMLGGLFVPEPVFQNCTADPSAPGAAIIDDMVASGGCQIIPQASLAPLDAASRHRQRRSARAAQTPRADRQRASRD